MRWEGYFRVLVIPVRPSLVVTEFPCAYRAQNIAGCTEMMKFYQTFLEYRYMPPDCLCLTGASAFIDAWRPHLPSTSSLNKNNESHIIQDIHLEVTTSCRLGKHTFHLPWYETLLCTTAKSNYGYMLQFRLFSFFWVMTKKKHQPKRINLTLAWAAIKTLITWEMAIPTLQSLTIYVHDITLSCYTKIATWTSLNLFNVLLCVLSFISW